MSYLALARKWRPRTFSQLIGQEHVNQVLINSLQQQRLHHAYLFTGTRGVGKTSVARILAKALNCEQGITAEPCLQCEACLSIEAGCFVDLIEIDAASKTRVEDTRELLENVAYASSGGRFKIYLIDEVHMLSQHSFNALLKTLEEPPSHVKFLLATTDPQKLPVTVLSRCLQFHLKNLLPPIITQQLTTILQEEQREANAAALEIIAKAAQGSMRDALSILDQVLVTTDESITEQHVKSILGYTQQDFALQLLTCLINQDGTQIINICRKIAVESGHFTYVLDEILHYLHEITLHQLLATDNRLLTPSMDIQALAKQISAEDTQLFYQIALKGKQEMALAPTLALGFEMTLLRMLAFRPLTFDATQPLTSSLAEVTPAPAVFTPLTSTQSQTAAQPIVAPIAAPPAAVQEIRQVTPNINKDAPQAPLQKNQQPPSIQTDSNDNWEQLLPQLKLAGMAKIAAENAELLSKNDHEVHLGINAGHQSLFTTAVTARIEQALCEYYQHKVKLKLSTDQPIQSSPAKKKQIETTARQENAQKSISADPFLQELEKKFSAEMIKNSISFQEDEL